MGWRWRARADQLPPVGEWFLWLILAGRGWGKTRAGAETVIAEAQSGAQRIALVGRTAADVRDVMIEGESGILACSPPDFRPRHIPSLRRIVWPNGAIATTYSGDKPDQLRGPQHSFAWCFIAGTMVLTASGEKPIESVAVGDMVVTRGGLRAVVANSAREATVGVVSFSNGRSLVGTPDHPVCAIPGWTRLDGLRRGDQVCAIDASHGAAGVGSSCPGRGHSAVSVVSTWQPVGARVVYCLKVEGLPEYVANGIVVHNCDELAAWRYPDSWAQLMFGLRLGKRPRVVATTTPRPTKLIRDLVKRDTTRVTRGSTFANASNLAGTFLDEMRKRYEGTRLGRQELDGEVLDDNPGALWSYGQLDALRVLRAGADPNIVGPRCPAMRRIVVGVDPAVSTNEDSDETGIVVAGRGVDGHLYTLDDCSGIYTPNQWARAVALACRKWGADCVVAEVNNGGDLVEQNIRTVTQRVRVIKVHAAHGKYTRAEPVSSLYERGVAHHVGTFPQLESQMAEWNPKTDDDSPDRVDALVYAMTELSGVAIPERAHRR